MIVDFYILPNRAEAFSCRTSHAAFTCLSSVNGAPIAKRITYLPDRTCKMVYEILFIKWGGQIGIIF